MNNFKGSNIYEETDSLVLVRKRIKKGGNRVESAF
jgi:hypothetical protein